MAIYNTETLAKASQHSCPEPAHKIRTWDVDSVHDLASVLAQSVISLLRTDPLYESKISTVKKLFHDVAPAFTASFTLWRHDILERFSRAVGIEEIIADEFIKEYNVQDWILGLTSGIARAVIVIKPSSSAQPHTMRIDRQAEVQVLHWIDRRLQTTANRQADKRDVGQWCQKERSGVRGIKGRSNRFG